MKDNRKKLLWILLVTLVAFELGFKPLGVAPMEKPADLEVATVVFDHGLVGIPTKPLPSEEAPPAAESAAPESAATESVAGESVAVESVALAPEPSALALQGASAESPEPSALPSLEALALTSGESAFGESAAASVGMSIEALEAEMWTWLDRRQVPVVTDGVTVSDREVKVRLAVPRDTPRDEVLRHRDEALAALVAQYSDRAGNATLKPIASAQKDRHLVVAELWRFQIRKPVPQVKLGLDLQGGTRIVMEAVPMTHFILSDPTTGAAAQAEAQAESATESTTESAAVSAETAASRAAGTEAWTAVSEGLRAELEGKGWRVYSIVPNASGAALDVVTAKEAEREAVKTQIRAYLATHRPGAVVLPEPESLFIKDDTIQRVREIMQRRVDLFGLSEPIIQTQGDRRVTVEIAGMTPENLRDAISEPADLKLMYIDPNRYQLQYVPIPLSQRDPRNPGKTERIEVTDAVTGRNVDHKTAINDPKSQVIVRGADMVDNSQARASQSGSYEVSFELKRQAAGTFRDFTSKHIKEPLAIVLNDVIESAPTIQTTIGAQGQITGGFSIQEANNLATLLNAGALPIKLEMKENRSVSATLGAANVQKSLLAGLAGILVVFVFMLLYYRLPGAIASLALTLYCGIVLAILVMFNAVLTLTGIAGLILGVGMAVDANILIFERMKEELRTKSLPMSLKVGFERAWTAIFDSNSTTLLTATILWLLGTGTVRGFATTLIVSVLASLFTAVYVSRVLLEAVISTRLGHHPHLFLGARPEALGREDASRGRRSL